LRWGSRFAIGQTMTIDPDQCQTMTDVRTGVDDVDRRIVALVARRFGYMDAAARIKLDRATVRDEARKAEVKEKVDAAAVALGVDRALMARIYEDLIETSIAHEFVVFDETRG
jgi:isochorismate pyruvate lyase